MVTRNRKFATSFGYSRRAGKRDVERLVAEEFEAEPTNRLPRLDGGNTQPSRAAFEFGPRVMPRSVLDLRAVARQIEAPGPTLQQLLLRLGQQLLRFSRRQAERLFRWISWR